MTRLPEYLVDRLAPSAGLLVAFSGGRDSTVLLHALGAVKSQLAPLRAIHVNHALSADAAAWERQCRAFAALVEVEYTSRRVHVDPHDARGLEAAARDARYAALKAELQPGETLLTAHHADDQLETILLQLMRGAGPRGIAGMPVAARFGPGKLVRPLLAMERAALAHYASVNRLDWIDDPGNADYRHDRNFLRHEVVPRLKQRWPAAATTAGRAARHAARARYLESDLAAIDLGAIGDSDTTLPIEPLLALGEARAENVVRHWLMTQGLPVPSTRRLDTLLTQMQTAGPDKTPRVSWQGAEARCWRGRLHAFSPLPEVAPLSGDWHGEPRRLGPGLGELRAVPAAPGLRPDVLAAGVALRWRTGGERIQLAGDQYHRRLKDLLRETGVVPWMRGRMPLLWHDDELVAVGDIWFSERFAAAPGTEAARIEWRDRPALY